MDVTDVKADVDSACRKVDELSHRALVQNDGDEIERAALQRIRNHLTEAASHLTSIESHRHGRVYPERRKRNRV